MTVCLCVQLIQMEVKRNTVPFYTPWPPIGPGSETLGCDQALVSSFSYKNNSETSFRDIEYVLALRHF